MSTTAMHAMSPRPHGLTILSLALVWGCSAASPPTGSSESRTFDFASGDATGWTSGYADYSTATAPTDVVAGLRAAPAPFAGNGFELSGTNRSDDLFIFAMTRIAGLEPRRVYRVMARVTFLTDVPSGCIGVGGSPGESVWISVAASTSEPRVVVQDDEFRLNVPRGNQASGGPSGVVLGNIANSVGACGASGWETKTLVSSPTAALTVTTDDQGAAWIVVGMDSGFEARSETFLRRLEFTLE